MIKNETKCFWKGLIESWLMETFLKDYSMRHFLLLLMLPTPAWYRFPDHGGSQVGFSICGLCNDLSVRADSSLCARVWLCCLCPSWSVQAEMVKPQFSFCLFSRGSICEVGKAAVCSYNFRLTRGRVFQPCCPSSRSSPSFPLLLLVPFSGPHMSQTMLYYIFSISGFTKTCWSSIGLSGTLTPPLLDHPILRVHTLPIIARLG